MKLSLLATIKNNQLNWNNPERLNQILEKLERKSQDKTTVKISFENLKHPRTTGKTGEKSNMNGYYWLYLQVIAEETGHEATDLHEYFKRALLIPKFIKVLNKEIKIPASTTKLNGLDMMEYMMKIERNTGIPIPPHPDTLL
jgi:hypothetical protein